MHEGRPRAIHAGRSGRRRAIESISMLGAIQKKIFVWKTGFWGESGLGWSYDLTCVSMLLVILSTDGGRFVLLH